MSIELPKDAEGREIPLDTKVLFDKDGHPKDVSLFTYAPRSYSSGWNVVLVDGFERFASAMHLTPPDSLEKLEEDLGKIVNHPKKIVCAYFGRERKDCDGCKLENCDYCICNFDISVAFASDNCDLKLPVEVMSWTLNWATDNLRDMHDAACEHFWHYNE